MTEREGFAFTQSLCASGLDSAIRVSRNPAPKNVVLTARVDTDHSPHLMIVRHHGHPWSPDNIEDRETGRSMKSLDLRSSGFAQGSQNGLGVLDGAYHDLTYRCEAGWLGRCG